MIFTQPWVDASSFPLPLLPALQRCKQPWWKCKLQFQWRSWQDSWTVLRTLHPILNYIITQPWNNLQADTSTLQWNFAWHFYGFVQFTVLPRCQTLIGRLGIVRMQSKPQIQQNLALCNFTTLFDWFCMSLGMFGLWARISMTAFFFTVRINKVLGFDVFPKQI